MKTGVDKEILLNEKEYLQDGIYTKEFSLPKGAQVVQHMHNYSHTSILAKGKVNLVINGKPTLIEAPKVLHLKAHDLHLIQALEDSLWYCIHYTEETNIHLICEKLIK